MANTVKEPSAPAGKDRLSRELRILDWTSGGIGLTGALLLALNVDVSRYGWIVFLAANVLAICFARGIGANGLLMQQCGFMFTSCLGIYRTFPVH